MGRELYLAAGVLVLAVIAVAALLAANRGGAPVTATVTVTSTVTATETVTATVTETVTAAGAGGKTQATAATETATAPAATTTAVTATAPTAGGEITVYTYEDFMAWGEDPQIFEKLLKRFEEETGIKVRLVRMKGAKAMVNQVIAEAKAGKPTADVVIGVDQATLQQLRAAGLVYRYRSPLADPVVADALSPEGCATPIDYGLIALVYDPQRLTKEQLDMIRDGVTLDELVKLAPVTVGEDPTRSSTGLNFLLYTIAVSRLEGRDWRQLWKQLLASGFMVAGSWGDAYDEFFREGSRRAVVVSYGTDPAYSAWYNAKHGGEEKPSVGAALLMLGNGSKAAWLQVEGAAIIDGGNVEAAKRFVDWLLSSEVQREIPTSQWMLPAAREKPELPSFYRYALTAGDADLVVDRVIKPEEYANIEKLLTEWLQVAQG